MKSLVIAPVLPADSGNGLAMRAGMFVEALHQLGEVDVLVLPVAGKLGEASLCRRLGIRPTIIEISGRGDTHYAMLRGLADPRARLEAFRRYGRPSLSAALSVSVLGDVRHYLAGRRFDMVHVARSYLLPVTGVFGEAPVNTLSTDLDEDDVETYRRIGALHGLRGNDGAKAWAEAEALSFERQTAHWLPRADLVFIATEKERDTILARYGVRPIVAANAVAPPASLPSRRAQPGALLFVGGFGYLPNLDAALWILDEILPRLREQSGRPVSLTLVGRNAPRELVERAAAMNAMVLENAEDLAPLYGDAGIALVPLRAGGGSRIKLLEAAAYGVPVVATSIGAENSGMEDGRDLWIADTPDEMARACITIWRDPSEAERRADNAKARVVAEYSRTAAISTLKRHFASRTPQVDA
jgi:glycosyltransferase involved in cell wall biosynthesis